MNRVGEKIKKERLKANISEKQIARMCGVSEAYFKDIESGRKIVNEEIIKKIEKALKTTLDENIYADNELEKQENSNIIEKEENKKNNYDIKNSEWENAFKNILKNIPVYNMDMSKIYSYKQIPIIDKKVEGYNIEKVIYILIDDDLMAGYRIKKGDYVMLVLNHEIRDNSICLIQYDGKICLRYIKKLDKENILIISNEKEIKTITKRNNEVKILGFCIKIEIYI